MIFGNRSSPIKLNCHSVRVVSLVAPSPIDLYLIKLATDSGYE